MFLVSLRKPGGKLKVDFQKKIKIQQSLVNRIYERAD